MTDPSGGGGVPSNEPRSWWNRLLRSIAWRQFKRISVGRLIVNERGERMEFGRPCCDLPCIEIYIDDARFFRYLIFGGSLGAAEAFIRGFWTCNDLVGLIQLFCRNSDVASGLDGKANAMFRAFAKFGHWLRKNNPSGSRRNISAHYDLGNEFFSLFLDETMAYSCGVFSRPGGSLEEASIEKFDRICRKLQLGPDDHLLEIGSGWGGFAIHAARRFGCRVTAATISQKQFEFTKNRIAEAGLDARVTVLCEDYRSLTGTYDKIVSVEMIEAVGYDFFDVFFGVCSRRLKPDGMMLLQAIVIPDQRFDRYRRSVDFIQRYVFPGGCLPSLGSICRSLGRSTDLQICHLEDITAHYVETLGHWRRNFMANLEHVRNQGFSEEFIRTWDFYFGYCEGGFCERAIGDVQIVLVKPEWRPVGSRPY